MGATQAQIDNITSAGVSGIVEGLTFDASITKDDFNAATNKAIAQLKAAQEAFGAASTDSVSTKVEKLVGYGLTIAQNACDAAGDTKLDAIFNVAETVDVELEGGTFNLFTAIKNLIAANKAKKAAGV